MRRMVRQVNEERPVFVLVDEPYRVIGDEIRQVALFGRQRIVMPPVRSSHHVDVRVVIQVTADETAELVEALMDGVELGEIPQMPLAEDGGRITFSL